MGRARSNTFRGDGKLTPRSAKAAHARHEADKRINGALGAALDALEEKGAPPADRHANGTNGAANGTANGHANGHAAPPLTTVATVAAPTAPAPSQASGRDPSGRFAEGNRAASGNPFHRAVAARRKALLDAISAEDVAAVGRKLCAQALAGDVSAAKVLLSYVIGKPAEAADPDRVALNEVALLLQSPHMAEMMTAANGRIPGDLAATVAALLLRATVAQAKGILDKKAEADAKAAADAAGAR